MAVCLPTPTLTLFSTTTSTNVITTSTVIVQTQPDGAVSTLTVPLIITTIVTVVDPTSTLFASCSTPINTTPPTTLPQPSPSTTPQPSPSPSIPQYTPTTVVITTTPPPTVVTEEQSSTLNNGVVTVVTITTTSTPLPTVIVFPTSAAASQSQTSKSSSSNIVPIVGGAVGGFFFLIGVVLILWLILKKCRKPDTDNREDEDIVFPYPVTRDRDETRRLDLAKESRPYEYGLVGRSMPTTSSGGPPSMIYDSGDGRRDSITALIGATGGLTPTMSGTVASIPGAQTRGGEVGRQGSHNSTHHQLPPGAAPPLDRHSPSVTGSGSVSGSSTAPGPSSRRPLQVINPPLSPISPASIRTGFSPDDVPSSGSVPMVAPEPEKQSVRSEKKSAHAFSSSSSGPILVHSDGGHIQDGDRRPSASGSGGVPERKPPAQPEPRTTSVVDPTDAPPAYVA